MFLECLHEFAHHMIHFKNEITVRPGLGLALEGVPSE